jgi:malate dehydrogenase (oxaloacetate-decarboxylating)(NADP+)
MDNASARRMRDALELLDQREPDFAYEGEMNIDAALDQSIRDRLLPGSRYEGARTCWSSPPARSPRACATS